MSTLDNKDKNNHSYKKIRLTPQTDIKLVHGII